MKKLREGSVVIVSTGQAGTITHIDTQAQVLLANGDLWHGPEHGCRFPQDQADLDACPLEVDRFIDR